MVLTWLRTFDALSENLHLHIQAHMNMYTQTDTHTKGASRSFSAIQ